MSRRPIAIAALALAGGCADILGIQDRYFDGGTTGDSSTDAATDSPVTDSAVDVVIDGGSSCASCTQNGAGCEVIACHQETPWSITVAGSNVVWANSTPLGGSNKVMSAPISGGAAKVAYPAGGFELRSLVSLDGNAYVGTSYGGTVVLIPGDGGAASPIASAPDIESLGIDPIDKYLVYGSYGNGGGVYQCGNPASAGCAGNYEAVPNQANVQGVAIDSNDVYFSTTTTQLGIYKCPWVVQCTSPTLLVSTSTKTPGAVAVDGSFVYWIEGNVTSYTLHRASKVDGSSPLLLASASWPIHFVVDSGNVYYAVADFSSGSVVRIKNDGSGATDLATGLVTASAVAVDATYVYFTEWGPYLDAGTGTDGRVMRVPR